jgi:hypothetical protein
MTLEASVAKANHVQGDKEKNCYSRAAGIPTAILVVRYADKKCPFSAHGEDCRT